VNIVFTGTDATSGIDSCTKVNYSGPDGSGLTVNGTCTDNAGNTSASVASSPFNYDATPPTTSKTLAGNVGNFVSPSSTITYNFTDALSGCGEIWVKITRPDSSVVGPVAVGCPSATGRFSSVYTIDGNYTIEFWGVDAAGNGELPHNSEVDYIDNTPPVSTKTIGSPQYVDGSGNVWVTSATSFTIACNDGAGVDVNTAFYRIDGGSWVSGTPPVSFTLPDGDGAHTIEHYCKDALGNTEATQSQTVYKDNTPPVITIDSPADGATFGRRDLVFADYFVADAGSGVCFVHGTVPSGSLIDTDTVGFQTFIVIARDCLGNESSLSHSYQVLFLPPQLEDEVLSQIQKDLQTQVEQAVSKEGFKSGDPIKLCFEFKDPRTGQAIPGALIRADLSEVLDLATGRLAFIRFLGAFTFDDETKLYCLEFATVDAAGNPLAAGRYRIYIYFNDGMKIQLDFTLS
jgi:hypothetical protein